MPVHLFATDRRCRETDSAVATGRLKKKKDYGLQVSRGWCVVLENNDLASSGMIDAAHATYRVGNEEIRRLEQSTPIEIRGFWIFEKVLPQLVDDAVSPLELKLHDLERLPRNG